MTGPMEIQLIALLVSVACSLPGCFLVLRSRAMLADAITHTMLLGIVLAFFWVEDLSSPLLMVGAAGMGVATVWLTEWLEKSRLVSEDSAIGLVFPLLFALAILLITKYAGSVHLDTDSVLLGELAFAPFDRMILFGMDVGAKGLYTCGGILILNLMLICCFYKELQLATFDPVLASVLGLLPTLLHYGLMALVSLTAVGAFESVGAVLVIAFMVGPPNIAYLLTDQLHHMLILSGVFAALSGMIGYQLAFWLDVSIAGSMAVAVGLLFGLVFLLSPKRKSKHGNQF